MNVTSMHPDFPTTCRVSYRQPVSEDGFVDAGWWPASTDLVAEAPALFESMWTAGREMTRLTYHLDSWDAAPRRLLVEGRRVHLSGYRRHNPLLVSISDARRGDHCDLLVIPFDTDRRIAECLLRLASEPANSRTAEQTFQAARS